MKVKNPQQREFEPFYREAAIEAAPVEGPQARLVNCIWTKGAVVRRSVYDWWNDEYVTFDEQLSVEPGDVDMSRLASGRAPLLDTHSGWNVRDSLLGVVKSADLKDGIGTAVLQISARDDLAGLWRDIQDGVVANVSVGYNVTEWEIHQREGQPELWIARKWIPMELSFVPMGADPDAGTQRDGKPSKDGRRTITSRIIHRAQPNSQQQETSMSEKKRGTGTEPAADDTINPPAAGNVVELDAARAEGAKTGAAAERQRISDVRTAVRDFGFPEADADAFISSGQDINQVRAVLQEKLAKRSTETRQHPHVIPGNQNERDTRIRLVGNAILHRANPGAHKLEDGARQYRSLSLLELAREVLREEGYQVRGLDRFELAGMAVGAVRAAGMHTTSDFPLILANSANKRLREVYDTQVSQWKLFSRQSNAPDFKSKFVAQLSEAPDLKRVPEHGEYKYGKLSEAGANYKLDTWGLIIAITRQAIINDDLGAFDRLPSMMGAAAARKEADIVWAILTANPTMSDGVALFHANHGNLAGAGAAIDVTSIGAARAAMRVQKNIGGLEILNITPKFLIVPAAKETIGEQFLSGQFMPTAQSGINPFRDKLQLITEARLDVASTTAWYLISDPNQIDTIEYAYLEGQEGVYTETRIGFEVDGIELKVRDDFAAAPIDWKGIYKNPGA